MSEILPPDPSGPRRVGAGQPEPEVGFAGARPLSATMLARYLVGRAIAARVSTSLMFMALLVIGLAVLDWFFGPHWLAVLIAFIALVILAFRALVMALLRRLMAVGRLGPAEDRIRGLVSETGGDLRRELRRLGLPGGIIGLPLLAVRLLGRRRTETLRRLQQFDVTRVVPRSRRDELAFVVRNDVLGRPR